MKMPASLCTLISVGLAVAAFGLAAGCGPFDGLSCTAAGCTDGLQLVFRPNEPQAGIHAIEGRVDGKPFRCDFDLRIGHSPDHPRPTCTDERIEPSSFYGGSEPPPGLILSFDWFQPAELELRILRGTKEMASWHLEPTYREVAPNGYECGPVCETASEELFF